MITSEQNRMDIASCFDHNYVMPQGIMMQSLCVNNKDVEIVFHLIIDESITLQDKDDLRDIAAQFPAKRVEFYSIESSFFKTLPRLEGRNLTQATYYRLFLSEILPDNINKVLFLDGDLIVRHSLLSLWDTNITAVALAGVSDVLSGWEISERLGYPSQLGYINAGVLLINLEYWRSHVVLSQFMDCIAQLGDKLFFHDQDVLNYVFRERKMMLPIKYNLISYFLYDYRQDQRDRHGQQMKVALQDPVIVHFIAETKPWQRNVNTPHMPHPFAAEFKSYQDQTKWKGVFNELRPVRIRIRQSVGDIARKVGLRKPLSPQYISL